MKGLEALEKIDHTICLNRLNKTIVFGLDIYQQCDCKDLTEFVECYDTIEKELKALEIIKEKRVNIGDFVRCKNIEDYNEYCCYNEKEKLTQEKFDLLKEVLYGMHDSSK